MMRANRISQIFLIFFGLTAGMVGFSILPWGGASSPTAFGSSISEFPLDSNVFVKLAKKIVPSVVNISTVSSVKGPFLQGGQDDVLKRFFGDLFRQYKGGTGGRGGDNGDEEDDGNLSPFAPPSGSQRLPKSMSLGTGVIIDASGLILTNNHVVADADEIKISFTESKDEKPSDAEVVGRDPEIDVALIKVKNKREMIPAVLGDSDVLDVGEFVMAVGNPFGQGHSVTHGIISAKGRLAPDFQLANYLQTDAPINPGNSGGPLVNLKGEVIGINNAIDQRAQGIGFAIPINFIKKVLPQLRSKGVVTRGFIGVLVEPLTPEVAKKIGVPSDLQGSFVTHVYPDQPAEKAGIRPYDVILEFNGVEIHQGADLIGAVVNVNVGDTAPVKVFRAGKKIELNVKVVQRPGAHQQLKVPQKGKQLEKRRVRIETGMTLEDITPEVAKELSISPKSGGVVVTNIAYGGPADLAGLNRGDVILDVDRKPIKNVEDFYSLVNSKQTFLLRVRHPDPQGQERFSVVILDLKPKNDS
jgi:serine protease Do